MKKIPLGQSDIMVPDMCLGSMTYSTQTSRTDAYAQIDMALDHEVNFIDTAWMYPVNPCLPETAGQSEAVIGEWGVKTGRRAEIIIATKHLGEGFKTQNGPAPMISSATIPGAIDASLKMLKTDYIDLYQFHWPNRGSYMFRKNWTYDPSSQNRDETIAHMADCMGALQDAVVAGKIRSFGLSNESAWGMSMWIEAASRCGGPRPVSNQNEYSLLCRLYDTDLAELSVNEDIALLAFSPLAAGLLTGKYQDGAVPERSRKTFGPTLGGRSRPRTYEAVDAYLSIARKHGLDPTNMALAFCRQRPFPVSAIFGATTNEQLTHILSGIDLVLSPEVLDDLDTAHRAHPMPY